MTKPRKSDPADLAKAQRLLAETADERAEIAREERERGEPTPHETPRRTRP